MNSTSINDEGLTRPIIGIENRTAQEVFDIMCDRIARSIPDTGAVEEPPRFMGDLDTAGAQAAHQMLRFATGKYASEAVGLVVATDIVRAYLAAAPAPSCGPGVVVRELEWVHGGKGDTRQEAKCILGLYRLALSNITGKWRWSFNALDCPWSIELPTYEEAKAAAQAHFNATILSAITLAPTTPETVEGEVVAFVNAVQLVEDAGWVVLRPEQARPAIPAVTDAMVEAALDAPVVGACPVIEYLDFTAEDAKEMGALLPDGENFSRVDIVRHDQWRAAGRAIMRTALLAALQGAEG